MSITSFVSKIFGNKAQRDMSEVQPIVEKSRQNTMSSVR